MMSDSDEELGYYRRRLREEQARAAQCASVEAGITHRKLAQLYEQRIAELERRARR